MRKQEKYTKTITGFLKQNPVLKITQLAKDAGVNPDKLRNSLYKGFNLSPDDIFNLMFQLAKFGISVEGFTLAADTNAGIIFSRKVIGSNTIVVNELKDGSTLRRTLTEEMQQQDEHGDTWDDPYKKQIISTAYEYAETVIRDIITDYNELP